MDRPPPYIVGVPKFWATLPSEGSYEKQFPVSIELFVAVREVLQIWTSEFLEVSEEETRTGQVVLNVFGQVLKEIMAVTVPRLLAIYIAMSDGIHPLSFFSKVQF